MFTAAGAESAERAVQWMQTLHTTTQNLPEDEQFRWSVDATLTVWFWKVSCKTVCTTQSVFAHPTAQLSTPGEIFYASLEQFAAARSIPLRVRRCGKPTFIVLVLVLVSLVAVVPGWAAPAVHLQSVVSGLNSPLDFQSARDGTSRFFIVEQAGTIRIIKGKKVLAPAFLDISSIIVSGGETGLLGLAFHPQYKSNGRSSSTTRGASTGNCKR